MDVDAMALLRQLPQIAARLHMMELRPEAKQAALAELSAADYKSRTGGGRRLGRRGLGRGVRREREEEVLRMTHPLWLPHGDDASRGPDRLHP